jgi:hypothetical protein
MRTIFQTSATAWESRCSNVIATDRESFLAFDMKSGAFQPYSAFIDSGF